MVQLPQSKLDVMSHYLNKVTMLRLGKPLFEKWSVQRGIACLGDVDMVVMLS